MRFLPSTQSKREKRRFFSSKKTRREQFEVTSRKRRRSTFGVVFLWGIFFVTLLYVTFFSHYIRIEHINVSKTERISSDEVMAYIEQELSGKYLGILPKDGFFVVRTSTFRDRIATTFPLFREVSMRRVFPDTLDIQIIERPNIVQWCSGGQCFLLDESGTVLTNENIFNEQNREFVVTVTDMSRQPVSSGQKIFEWDFASFVMSLDPVFWERFGIQTEPSYMTASRFADDIRLMTTEGWEVYLNTRVPIETSIGALGLLFEKELSLPEERAKLRYIDLRTENRVHYTFRDASESE